MVKIRDTTLVGVLIFLDIIKSPPTFSSTVSKPIENIRSASLQSATAPSCACIRHLARLPGAVSHRKFQMITCLDLPSSHPSLKYFSNRSPSSLQIQQSMANSQKG